MSIENITAKIIADAQDESNGILKEAGYRSQTTIEKAKQQAEKLLKEAEEEARADAELLKSRRRSVAELEVRKMRLGAKQDLIARSFDAAMDLLANMNEEEYLKLLVNAITATGVEGGELLLSPKDQKNLGHKLVDMVNSTGKAGTVTLAEDTMDARGGFVLRKGAVEINSTLETMVNAIRESTISEVVTALFR